MDKEQLFKKIEAAFPTVPQPHASEIVETSDFERLELQADLAGKSWKDLTVELMIPKHKDDIFLLSDKAFRYFIPGYMKLVIDHFDEIDLLVDTVIHSLNRNFMVPGHFDKIVTGFNFEQKTAIKHFLEYSLVNTDDEFFQNDIREAIDAYWKYVI